MKWDAGGCGDIGPKLKEVASLVELPPPLRYCLRPKESRGVGLIFALGEE